MKLLMRLNIWLKEIPPKNIGTDEGKTHAEKYCFVFFPVCLAFQQSSEELENT